MQPLQWWLKEAYFLVILWKQVIKSWENEYIVKFYIWRHSPLCLRKGRLSTSRRVLHVMLYTMTAWRWGWWWHRNVPELLDCHRSHSHVHSRCASQRAAWRESWSESGSSETSSRLPVDATSCSRPRSQDCCTYTWHPVQWTSGTRAILEA